MQNHYVPEFYFKPWLDDKKHLLRFGRMRGKLTRDQKTPGQICYVDDLHTFSRPMGNYSVDAVETWLTDQVDTRTAGAIERIISGGVGTLTNEEANRVALFVQSLIVRHPTQMHLLRERATEDFKLTMAMHDEQMVREGGESPEMHGFSSLLDYAEQVHPGLVDNVGKVMMTDIIADKKYRQRLLDMERWTIDFSGTSIVPIVTTDRPLAMLGTGLLDPNVILVLPLSPSVVFYHSPLGIRSKMLVNGAGFLGVRTQHVILSNAWRYAFGTSQSNLNLIERYLPRGDHTP